MSYNPASPSNQALCRFAGGLARLPGIEVILKERQATSAPRCPACHESVSACPRPTCRASMRRMTEKGIDTAIVTDMMQLAWDDGWDVAVLVSADADFVPVVETLSKKGRMVIHGGMPPSGWRLARACYGSIDVSRAITEIPRGIAA
jgi:uncharacterized LabA/DUF88 family protein